MGKISELHTWWNDLVKFGYFPNAAKPWLVTKEGTYNLGVELFGAEGIQVTDEGRPYLGAAIGTRSYVENYMSSKVTQWSSQLSNLVNHEVTLFSMPVRNGGLGIRLPSTVSDTEFQSVTLITSSLCAHIANQDPSYSPNIAQNQS